MTSPTRRMQARDGVIEGKDAALSAKDEAIATLTESRSASCHHNLFSERLLNSLHATRLDRDGMFHSGCTGKWSRYPGYPGQLVPRLLSGQRLHHNLRVQCFSPCGCSLHSRVVGE